MDSEHDDDDFEPNDKLIGAADALVNLDLDGDDDDTWINVIKYNDGTFDDVITTEIDNVVTAIANNDDATPEDVFVAAGLNLLGDLMAVAKHKLDGDHAEHIAAVDRSITHAVEYARDALKYRAWVGTPEPARDGG